MTDIKDALRDYLEASQPVSLEETIEGATPPPKMPNSRQLRPLLVAATAATVVVLLVGGAALLTTGDTAPLVSQPPQPSSTIPQATTQAAPDTTVSPPSTGAPSSTVATTAVPPTTTSTTLPPPSTVTGDGWTKRTVPGLFGYSPMYSDESGDLWPLLGNGEVRDIAARGETIVVIGGASPPTSNRRVWARTVRPTARISQDFGATWQTIDLGEAGDSIWSVTASDSGFLAVGWPGVVWSSPDGVTWERHVDPEFTRAALSGVAAGPGGYVASGICPELDTCPIAMWASPDGETWTQTHLDPEGNWLIIPTDIVGGDERYIVTAMIPTRAGPEPAFPFLRVWISPDGQTWTKHEVDGSPLPNMGVTTPASRPFVAASEQGMVVGYRFGRFGLPMVLHSANGTDWAPIVLADDAACTRVAFADVTTTPQGFLAVGTCDGRAGIWTSDSGATWQLTSTQHPVFNGDPQLALSNERGVLVIGSESDIWTTAAIP